MFVYTDIIQPVLVGDSQVSCLRVITIPKTSEYGGQCNLIFEKIYYVKVLSHIIQEIEINIKDETGEDIKFEYGRLMLKLHFRTWKSFI